MVGIRGYLDSIGQGDTPIWITELGLHWGWDQMAWGVDGCDGLPSPAGTYQTQQVIDYLREIFDWLEANGAILNVEKWFLFRSYYDITKCNQAAYAGLTLFDGPGPGAALTPVGRFFRDRVLGIR